MDWNDLKVFLALERGQTARSAAKVLGISHSTVLRRLQMLEDSLGAQVFDRTPDGLLMTGPGERLLIKAQQIEAEMLEVQRDVAGADVVLKGPVRLTAPPAVLKYMMLPVFSQFRMAHPEIELEVVATNAFSDLSRRDADIAIRFSNEPDDYLVGRKLPEFHDAIYVKRDQGKATSGQRYSQEMGWVGWQNAERFKQRITTTPFPNVPVQWHLPSLELQAQAAREGLGMALLPCVMGDQDHALERREPGFTQPTIPAWLLQHPDLRRLERVRVFSQFVYNAIIAQSDRIAGRLPGHR